MELVEFGGAVIFIKLVTDAAEASVLEVEEEEEEEFLADLGLALSFLFTRKNIGILMGFILNFKTHYNTSIFKNKN